MAQVQEGGAVKRPAAIEDDRGSQCERDPLPVHELPRRHHGQGNQRRGEDDRDDQASLQTAFVAGGGSFSWALIPSYREVSGVADFGHLLEEGIRRNRGGVLDLCCVVDQIDCGRDAGDLGQRLLDAGDAARAGHALDVENYRGRWGCLLSHATPPSSP